MKTTNKQQNSYNNTIMLIYYQLGKLERTNNLHKKGQ